MSPHEDKSMEYKILDTAERLFLEKGFALTSTTEIARETGCNQALVHYYFRTKEKLFEAIFEKKVLMFMTAFMQICKEDIPFEEKLKRAISTHFDVLFANPQLPFLILNELITNPVRIKALKEKMGPLPLQVFTQFETELAAEIKQGRIRPVSPVNVLLSMISLNVAPFLLSPVLKEITGFSPEYMKAMLLSRKEEHMAIILKSLKP